MIKDIYMDTIKFIRVISLFPLLLYMSSQCGNVWTAGVVGLLKWLITER